MRRSTRNKKNNNEKGNTNNNKNSRKRGRKNILFDEDFNKQDVFLSEQYNKERMNPYIINCYTTLAKELTIDEVVQIINDCFYLDCQIKKGLIDANDAINYLKVRRYNGVTN